MDVRGTDGENDSGYAFMRKLSPGGDGNLGVVHRRTLVSLRRKKLLDRSTEEEYYPHKTVSKDRHADIGEYDYEEGSEIWRKLSGERKAV